MWRRIGLDCVLDDMEQVNAMFDVQQLTPKKLNGVPELESPGVRSTGLLLWIVQFSCRKIIYIEWSCQGDIINSRGMTTLSVLPL